MTTSRRKFIQSTAQTGLAAAALSAFPPSIRKAMAIPAFNETGTIRDVKHVVVLTQENRSLDQYFGTLKGVRGFGDRFTVPQPGGRSVWEQLDRTGNPVLPYHLDSTQGNAQRVSGTPHSWVDGQLAWLDGRIGYWPAVKNTFSMGHYEQAEVPFQFALADAFTICDGYHCSMHTGTNSNRLFLWTGTNGPTGKGVASLNNEWDSFSPSDTGSVGLRVGHLSGTAAGGRRELDRLREHAGQLRRQLAGRLQAVPRRERRVRQARRHRRRPVPRLRSGRRRRPQPAVQGRRQHDAGDGRRRGFLFRPVPRRLHERQAAAGVVGRRAGHLFGASGPVEPGAEHPGTSSRCSMR